MRTLRDEEGDVSQDDGGADADTFQPMNANFGLFPPLYTDDLPKKQRPRGRDRKVKLSERALADFAVWLDAENALAAE